MAWPALIDRLAAFAGIEPFYFDIHGGRHETAADTKVQVLKALGVDVSSQASAERSLADIESRPWRCVLPTTVFCDVDAANLAVDLKLPEGDSRVWRWELELESREVRSGEFRAEQLDLGDAREVDGRRIERRRLILAQPLPAGYHRLRIAGQTKSEAAIVAAPRRCYLSESLAHGRRLWGIATHVYSLRSSENWGIGDFSDLKALTKMAEHAGASFVAVNPFHALFPGRPEHASPYSPSSRLFVNPLYAGVNRAPEPDISNLRAAPFIDYTGVWAAKGKALESLAELEGALANPDFDAFCKQGGDALDRFATFMTLSEVAGAKPSWRQWPAHYRKPGSAAVKRFATEWADRVRRHKYLQFLADHQLRGIASQANDAGMCIGLIRDLALGVDPDGADAWAYQDEFVGELRCGAPRDDFHPEGQEWGVLPLNPIRLRLDHRTYTQLLNANMRHAGGLRIDHIIGIDRQFVVPLGGTPAQGCYLRYPTDELMRLIALESQRSKCMVIGEDLGTVPEGLRQRMHDAQLFGCSILYFERRNGGAFRSPPEYRQHTIASAGTHDLPTIAGYWAGRDIEAQEKAGIRTGESVGHAAARRMEDKRRLLSALAQSGALDHAQIEGMPDRETLRRAIHTFLSSSSAQLFAAQVDDLLDEMMQLNLPGTVDTYPNWRRRLRVALEDPAFMQALSDLARTARARSASPDLQA